MAHGRRDAGPLPVLGIVVGEDRRRRLDAGDLAVERAVHAGVDEIVRGDERVVLRAEIVAAAHAGIAAVEPAVAALVADARPGIRPIDAPRAADVDALLAQAVAHEVAQEIAAEAAEIARLRAAAARLHGDVDGVAAGILHALGQIDVDGVVADAEEFHARALNDCLVHTSPRRAPLARAPCAGIPPADAGGTLASSAHQRAREAISIPSSTCSAASSADGCATRRAGRRCGAAPIAARSGRRSGGCADRCPSSRSPWCRR